MWMWVVEWSRRSTVSVEVRGAEAVDVEGIRSVGRACWPDTYAFAGGSYIEHGLALWWSGEATERSLRDTAVVVAVQGGRVVGMGNVDLRGETPTIWKLYVLAEMRGAGVGTALLDALLDRIPWTESGWSTPTEMPAPPGSTHGADSSRPAGSRGRGPSGRTPCGPESRFPGRANRDRRRLRPVCWESCRGPRDLPPARARLRSP